MTTRQNKLTVFIQGRKYFAGLISVVEGDCRKIFHYGNFPIYGICLFYVLSGIALRTYIIVIFPFNWYTVLRESLAGKNFPGLLKVEFWQSNFAYCGTRHSLWVWQVATPTIMRGKETTNEIEMNWCEVETID